MSYVRDFLAIQSFVVFGTIAKNGLRFGLQSCCSVRYCPLTTQQLDRCNPKLYMFDKPVAKRMCNKLEKRLVGYQHQFMHLGGGGGPSKGLGRVLITSDITVRSRVVYTVSLARLLSSMGIRKTIFYGAESVDSKSSTAHTPSIVLFQARCLSWFLPGHSGLGLGTRRCRLHPG